MAVATVIRKTEKFDLKTLPGGYVILRRMTYGEKMTRLEMSGKMKVLGKAKKQNNGGEPDAIGEIDMMNRRVTFWEFANLVIDHNLEHQDIEDGPIRPLNFRMEHDVTLLAAPIGEEISKYIDELNNFEDDEDQGNSSGASAPQ